MSVQQLRLGLTEDSRTTDSGFKLAQSGRDLYVLCMFILYLSHSHECDPTYALTVLQIWSIKCGLGALFDQVVHKKEKKVIVIIPSN